MQFNCKKSKALKNLQMKYNNLLSRSEREKNIFSNSHYSNLVEGSFYKVVVAKVTTLFTSMCSAYVYHFISALRGSIMALHLGNDFFKKAYKTS